MSRPARLSLLRALLAEGRYGSQQELSAALEADGVSVSQPTLSKDLVTLGAIKRRAADGSLVYTSAVEGEAPHAARDAFARLCSELLHSLQSAGNQIVLRTPPGAAQFLAASLDAARLAGVMGTIAGDDTVLVIAGDDVAAARLVSSMSEMTRTGKALQEETR